MILEGDNTSFFYINYSLYSMRCLADLEDLALRSVESNCAYLGTRRGSQSAGGW